MERETRMLLWTLFAVGVLTVGLLPAAFGSFNHLVAIGVKSNANMAQTLWGQSTEPSSYVSGWADNTTVPLIPGAVEGVLQQATWNTDTWPPTLVLTGYGFGNPSTDASKATLTIVDDSRGWVASNGPSTAVQAVVQSWSNNKIVISGFTNYGGTDLTNWADGQGSWVFAPEDAFTVTVTNPQTGNSGTLRGVVPQGGARPSIDLNPLATLVVGQSTALSGRVTLAGQPLANQTVSVTASSGTLGGSVYTNQPSEHAVVTDDNGAFSIPYTATSPGTASNTASADGQTVNEGISVVQPTASIEILSPSPLPTSVPLGQQIELQASANVLPSGDRIAIVEDHSGSSQVLATAATLPLPLWHTESVPGQDSYFSEILAPDGSVLVRSTSFAVNWSEPLSVQVTEFTPDGSDSGSPEHEYYLSMSVNGDNLTRNIQLTNLTHPGTTFPGDFDFVASSLTNQTFVTETTTGAMPGDVMQVSVKTTGGVWISQNVTLPGITGACLYGCPEWTNH